MLMNIRTPLYAKMKHLKILSSWGKTLVHGGHRYEQWKLEKISVDLGLPLKDIDLNSQKELWLLYMHRHKDYPKITMKLSQGTQEL